MLCKGVLQTPLKVSLFAIYFCLTIKNKIQECFNEMRDFL